MHMGRETGFQKFCFYTNSGLARHPSGIVSEGPAIDGARL